MSMRSWSTHHCCRLERNPHQRHLQVCTKEQQLWGKEQRSARSPQQRDVMLHTIFLNLKEQKAEGGNPAPRPTLNHRRLWPAAVKEVTALEAEKNTRMNIHPGCKAGRRAFVPATDIKYAEITRQKQRCGSLEDPETCGEASQRLPGWVRSQGVLNHGDLNLPLCSFGRRVHTGWK